MTGRAWAARAGAFAGVGVGGFLSRGSPSPHPSPGSYYAIEGPPPGSYIAELIDAVRLPNVQCEHLRIPAKEYRDKKAAKDLKEKERQQAQAKAIVIPAPPPA